MGDLLESFPGNVWVRTKHAGKAWDDLWGQSTILEVVLDNCPWFRIGWAVTLCSLNSPYPCGDHTQVIWWLIIHMWYSISPKMFLNKTWMKKGIGMVGWKITFLIEQIHLQGFTRPQVKQIKLLKPSLLSQNHHLLCTMNPLIPSSAQVGSHHG